MANTKYDIFDSDKEMPSVNLKITSNKNVREVCRVFTEMEGAPFQERLHYAKIGEIQPDRYEENEDGEEEAIYVFENKIRSRAIYYARLAEKLFYGCPELTKEESEGYVFTEKGEELREAIIRSAIYEASEDFFLMFGEQLYRQNEYLKGLPNDLIEKIMDKAMSRTESRADTEQILNSGTTDSETST